ncbi:espin isoform X1 [Lates japonicus]|uniref:Espin isoform X1 n=1 Tax=Lates japonicus TaxID=270547 RepID=A0AAD3NP53_LATJO|nr:espin isoform X1 [Lates japonicus]
MFSLRISHACRNNRKVNSFHQTDNFAASGHYQPQEWHYSHVHNAILGPFGELMTEDDLNRIEKQIENLQVMHKVSEVEKELEELERELHQLLPVSAALNQGHFSVNPKQVHGQAEDLPAWCSKISTLLKSMAILLATLGGKEIDILDLICPVYSQEEARTVSASPSETAVSAGTGFIGRSQSFSTREDVENEIKQCGVSVKNLKANYEIQNQSQSVDNKANKLLEMNMSRSERKFRHLLCYEMFDRLGSHKWEVIRQFHKEVMEEIERGKRDWADGFEDIKLKYFGDSDVSPSSSPPAAAQDGISNNNQCVDQKSLKNSLEDNAQGNVKASEQITSNEAVVCNGKKVERGRAWQLKLYNTLMGASETTDHSPESSVESVKMFTCYDLKCRRPHVDKPQQRDEPTEKTQVKVIYGRVCNEKSSNTLLTAFGRKAEHPMLTTMVGPLKLILIPDKRKSRIRSMRERKLICVLASKVT